MKTFIILPVHSVVDLITNSSSEIFTFAASDAPAKIKKLVNELMKLAGSFKTADELFKIEVVDSYDIEGGDLEFKGKKYRSWDNIYLTKEEAAELGDRVTPQSNEYDFVESEIRVTALVPEAEETAKILSSLDGLFHQEAIMG